MNRATVPSGFRRASLALAACAMLAATGLARAEEAIPVEGGLPVEEATLTVPLPDVGPPPVPVPPIPVQPFFFDAAHAPRVSTVLASVDLSEQKMRVYIDGHLIHTFAVSTARRGYITPVGDYQPEWLDRYHRSKKYHNSPMPWSVFFHDGYAVHGTTAVRSLGRPASHGCVRLHPENAKIFFKLVQAVGKQNVQIAVVR